MLFDSWSLQSATFATEARVQRSIAGGHFTVCCCYVSKIFLIQMTTICKAVTKVATASVYGSGTAVAQTKLLDMAQSMLTTRVSIINLKLCGKFLLTCKIALHLHVCVHFVMAQLFFGANIIPCQRFNTDEKLQYFLMLLQACYRTFKATQ